MKVRRAPTNAAAVWNGNGSLLPAPMLATSGTPKDVDPGQSWNLGMKWDGMRTMPGVTEGAVQLASRNGKGVTDQYPELQ